MQFKITLQILHPGQLLPLSYQYELSSWIYSLIRNSNSGFAEFLHDKGYVTDKKRFKFFTFSNLYVPPPFEIQGDRMKVNSREISFVASFLVPQTAQDMVLGLFGGEAFRIGDKISAVDLKVKGAEIRRPFTPQTGPVRITTTSPLLLAKAYTLPNGKLRHQYLAPTDEGYADLFFQNLHQKYQTAQAHQLVNALSDNTPCTFRLLNRPVKRRTIRIKAFTPAETRVVGYNYQFELTGPWELIRLGLLAGFGGENALGFGASRVVG